MTIQQTNWKEYTGSDDQIKELNTALHQSNNGVLIELDGKSRIIYANLHGYRFNNYLICNPHPRREMMKQQADTGQPVWVKRRHVRIGFAVETTWIKYSFDAPTTTPNWNILNAEYSFIPFNEL